MENWNSFMADALWERAELEWKLENFLPIATAVAFVAGVALGFILG